MSTSTTIEMNTPVSQITSLSHSASQGAIDLFRYGRIRILNFIDINLSSDITFTSGLSNSDKPIREYDTTLCNYSSNNTARVWIRTNGTLGVAPSNPNMLYTGELVYISNDI